jgi:hypothetical protein
VAEYYLTIGPIEDDPDGLSAEDRVELLEAAGWRDVNIEWVGKPTMTYECSVDTVTQWNYDNETIVYT